MGSFDVPLADERTQLDAFFEEYRGAIEATPTSCANRFSPTEPAHECGRIPPTA